jgi:hypothetical protein
VVAPPAGTLDPTLTNHQAAELAPLLADLDRVVVIGSVHPRPYVSGMAPEEISTLIARIGTVPSHSPYPC